MFGQVYRIRIRPEYSMKILDWIRIAKISNLFITSFWWFGFFLKMCLHSIRIFNHARNRGGTGTGVPESTPVGFCIFLSHPDPE